MRMITNLTNLHETQFPEDPTVIVDLRKVKKSPKITEDIQHSADMSTFILSMCCVKSMDV